MPAIITNLWFDHQALEAAEFYCSVFPDSGVDLVTNYTEVGPGPVGTPVTVDFHLDGTRFTAINGGPMFTFSEAISLLIECADQAEVDHYWEALSDGGQVQQCGWLKDRYGLSWQVVPAQLAELMADPDPARASRGMAAMMSMEKIDLAALLAAVDSDG
jgi:predicted 3-demethylubiquinone-9 3-methyltransferase (glyoxalase superfamily)